MEGEAEQRSPYSCIVARSIAFSTELNSTQHWRTQWAVWISITDRHRYRQTQVAQAAVCEWGTHLITRLHSHPGPLCRFLFSCSMPSSPPNPSSPPSTPPLLLLLLLFLTLSLSLSLSSSAIFLPAAFPRASFLPISPRKSYPVEPIPSGTREKPYTAFILVTSFRSRIVAPFETPFSRLVNIFALSKIFDTVARDG